MLLQNNQKLEVFGASVPTFPIDPCTFIRRSKPLTEINMPVIIAQHPLVVAVVVLAATICVVSSFQNIGRRFHECRCLCGTTESGSEKWLAVSVPLGRGYKTISCKFQPLFPKSSIFAITYPVPCELNVDAPSAACPVPMVNQDSATAGGEMRGDLLRATTCWSPGFADIGAGAAADIVKFAGNVKWRKGVFDCTGAPWQETLDALLSNTPERSDSITLVFERGLP